MRRQPRISAATRRKLYNRPSTELAPREAAIDTITQRLYAPHFRFWYAKLAEVIKANKEYHGRDGDPQEFGLYYGGKAWFLPYSINNSASEATAWQVITVRQADDFEIIALHPKFPQLEKDVINITANLSELDIEFYEIKRFLAGVLLFKVPFETLKKTLGDTLYNFMEESLNKLNLTIYQDPSTEIAFTTYTKEHDYLIDAMCQRIMMNLIAVDALRI